MLAKSQEEDLRCKSHRLDNQFMHIVEHSVNRCAIPLNDEVWQQKHAAENPSSPSGVPLMWTPNPTACAVCLFAVENGGHHNGCIASTCCPTESSKSECLGLEGEAGTTPKAKTAKSTSDDATSGRKAERGRGRPSTKSHQASSGSGIGHHKENKEGKENKEKGKRANQPSSVKRTLDMFFPMKKELSADGSSAAAPPSPKQQKLFGFFKGGRSSASSSDGQAERPAETTAEEAASPELKRCKLESDAEPAGITSVPPYCG
ncbi:unnamed protein product [Polarella glacialis]|uniref:Uncharacterized protein n=1 Tax=Polarella glacialis TaxID=89957 RepID=A0A813EIH5_POLGL|nr:unnamed protein product [Polarella glacialis]